MSEPMKCSKGHELVASDSVGPARHGTVVVPIMAGFLACPTCRWTEYANDVHQPRLFDAEGRRAYLKADGSIAIHAFEKDGLGRAPFSFVGIEYRIGPMLVGVHDGVESYVGAPGQPCGVCAHCGTGIAECCVIQDATGKTFIVGNVCVGKTGDGGLRVAVKSALAKFKAEQRKTKEAEKLARLETLRGREDVAAMLSAHPHPLAEQTYGPNKNKPFEGKTRLDWALWNVTRGGTKAKLEVLRFIEKNLAGAIL